MFGINPEAYFVDVLSRVDAHLVLKIDELTLRYWKSAKGLKKDRDLTKTARFVHRDALKEHLQ